MSIDELNLRLDRKLFDEVDSAKAKLLLEAIRDWPDGVTSSEEYLASVQSDLNCTEVDYQIVFESTKKLKPNIDAWKMESYSTLIELLEFCHKSLNDIILDFEKLKHN